MSVSKLLILGKALTQTWLNFGGADYEVGTFEISTRETTHPNGAGTC